MFQSFTGDARRPRQVNLGGRTTNPFAAFPSGRQHPHPRAGPHNALAVAQQERLLRQQERDRLGAGRTLQRSWRGYRSRKRTHSAWRAEWDATEQRRTGTTDLSFESAANHAGPYVAYQSVDECLSQLRLLIQFLETSKVEDVARLVYFSNIFETTVQEVPTIAAGGERIVVLLGRLAKVTLSVLRSTASSSSKSVLVFAVNPLSELLIFLTHLIPKKMASMAEEYYAVMSLLTKNIHALAYRANLSSDTIVESVLAILRPITSETLTSYEWFAKGYLTISDLPKYLGTLDGLANSINYKLLISTLEHWDFHTNDMDIADTRLWLLAYLIYFYRYTFADHVNVAQQAPEPAFVDVMSRILNPIALNVSRRLESDDINPTDDSPHDTEPLPPFVKEQIVSLLNQRTITGLLSHHHPKGLLQQAGVDDHQSNASREARILASYALTLLRVFSRRGDDIRMWLYLGSADSSESIDLNGGQVPGTRIPAIKYFWQASRSSRTFQAIGRDSKNAVPLLKLSNQRGAMPSEADDSTQEWTIILLFLELYTFVLKVMDDEEFFSSRSSFFASTNTRVSWTRESALPLKDVEEMTVFLKNLAFALYWNAGELNEAETSQQDTAGGIRNYFSSFGPPPSSSSNLKEAEVRNREKGLPGVTGIPLDYFRGLVTGLLRMIHERDSRRKFLPDGHWLMTSHFDMEGFIPAVVAEEENRHQLQGEDEGEDGDRLMNDEYGDEPFSELIGTGRVQQIRRIEALRRRQQQAARARQLQSVAPRLEILRNMPFFIPFATRVQIFREFIFRDQMRRRHGYVDPDAWRMSVAQNAMGHMMMMGGLSASNDTLRKHHADIHRESVFEDAYEEFYQLGDGLKEPIQITFIDKFDTVEAGIDGGGVTKEFLTSVTNEALKNPSKKVRLFEENDQHLLYPTLSSVEERKELLRRQGINDGTVYFNDRVRSLLRRYEFLGRIIGKCLYEGILVDVNFAPFFLLKWALTGGIGSAQRESAYRANINDLKDLDAGLYQGLVSYFPLLYMND